MEFIGNLGTKEDDFLPQLPYKFVRKQIIILRIKIASFQS